MIKNVGKKNFILCLLFVCMFICTSCGSMPSTSFQEQVERQEEFENNSKESGEENEEVRDASEKAEQPELSTDSRKKAKQKKAESEKKAKQEYEAFMDAYGDEDNVKPIDATEEGLYWFYTFHDAMYEWALPIVAISVPLGILILVFGRGSKTMQKFGLIGFIITIPLVVLFLTWGVSLFESWIS